MLLPAGALLASRQRYFGSDCERGAVVYNQPSIGGTSASSR
jgi:hypothetical protein